MPYIFTGIQAFLISTIELPFIFFMMKMHIILILKIFHHEEEFFYFEKKKIIKLDNLELLLKIINFIIELRPLDRF